MSYIVCREEENSKEWWVSSYRLQVTGFEFQVKNTMQLDNQENGKLANWLIDLDW